MRTITLLSFFLIVSIFNTSSAQEVTNITPANPFLQYTGRITTSSSVATLYYGGTYITTKFQGTSLKAKLKDSNGQNYVGFIIDGGAMISKTGISTSSTATITIATGLTNTTHDLIIVKRRGPTAGAVMFYGLTLDTGKSLEAPAARPTKRIEIYGNSVSAGTNADNPTTSEGAGEMDNGWNAYGNVLARKLGAEIHNNGIPGIAILKNTGWYAPEAEYNYVRLCPISGALTAWDFTAYIPQLVIMAYGVNDDSFVKNTSLAPTWVTRYKSMVNDLMTKYPNAHFILTIPPMKDRHPEMVTLMKQVVTEINSPRVHSFDFVVGTSPNHPSMTMHQAMADELYTYVNGLNLFTSAGVDDNLALEELISIYPNPAKNIVTVNFLSNQVNTNSMIHITDLTGKTIHKSTSKTASQMTINTTDFAKGIYLLSVQSGNKRDTKKLVIQQ